jgi:Cytochrome c554 and c-prime
MGRTGLLLLAAAFAVSLSVLRPSPPAHRGLVLGPDGPIAHATVRHQGTAIETRSDRRGLFTLPRLAEGRRITASRDGFLIGGSHGSFIHLTPLLAEDDEAYSWVDPTPDPADARRCGNCHRTIHREWASGGHARSAMGRHFLDLYAGSANEARPSWSLLHEYPDGSGVCASCHAPSLAADDPALYDLRKVSGVAARGTHCDFCHKVAGPGEGEVGLAHGHFGLRLSRPREGQRFFGPLDDVDRGEDVHSPFMRDSRYCASCHEGVVFGVHVYTTYSEWQASPARAAGQSCQWCHMRPTGRMTNIAPHKGGIERDPATLGNHLFWDGSQAAMLRRSLDLRVEASPGNEVTLRLTAKGVGHRVPTGFIDRQLILSVEAQDSQGRAVALTGPRLPVSVGRILAGKSGKLYARQLRDEDGRSPAPFWRAIPEPIDTRLQPEVPDLLRLRLPVGTARLRVQVRHRRFWEEVRLAKGWELDDIVVIDRWVEIAR